MRARSGAIVMPQSVQGAQAVKLELDLKWLRRAGVKAPLMLKNVYLQDVDTQVKLQREIRRKKSVSS